MRALSLCDDRWGGRTLAQARATCSGEVGSGPSSCQAARLPQPTTYRPPPSDAFHSPILPLKLIGPSISGKQGGIKTFPIADSEDYDDVTPPKHSSNDPTEATEDDDRIYNPSRPKKPPLTEESKENSKGKGPKLPTNKQPPKISTPPPASNAVAPISMEVPLPKGPDSFEHDDDPTRTTYCVKPFDPTKKLVQYALVIDAGSTGSRIHAYKFNYCNAAPMLEYETFKMTRPGLSSFKDSPSKAAGSLNELLDEALRVVPETLRKCTPIAVKATAGLRLLGEKESNAILKEVEHHIRNDYPFPLIEKEPVVVMDGKDEGWSYIVILVVPS